jgi:type VI secretion system (T6SS) amidase immunity protein Tai4
MVGPLTLSPARGFLSTASKALAAAALLVLAAAAADGRVEYSPAQYLKNFALSRCIALGYKSDEAVKDSSAAAGGYLELGSFPMEAYEEADLLAKKFLAREYKGKHGEKLTLMKCIDLFHSEELEQLTKKYGKT